MTSLVTTKEFSEIIGVSIDAVRMAVREGRITGVKDNGVWKLDPEAAKREWECNTQKSPATVKNRQAMHTLGEHDDSMSFAEAERLEKVWKAKIAETKAKKEMGELVPAEKVGRDAFEIARKVRDAILMVPARVSHELAAEVDPHKVEVQLTKELNQALSELANKRGNDVVETDS